MDIEKGSFDRAVSIDMDHGPDNLLMLQVRDGDLDKLGVLFERYKMRLYRYFYLRTGNAAGSEDLVQNVFVRIIRYRDRYEPVGEFRSWLFRIAHNLAVDFVRKRARRRSLDDLHDEPVDWNTAERNTLKEERVKLLEKALFRLRDDYRELLILSRYQGLKYGEIADIAGCSPEAVKLRIHRAMKELRALYMELE